MANRESGSHVAVFFIGNNEVTRHMLFSEFEALLDGLVALPDYADEEAKAVYVVIGEAGKVEAAVFFLLYFDEKGIADVSWNVPVERLSGISGSGPDLGGGPIRLACRGQCAINWHQNDLWDPDMTPGSNDFLLIKKAVEENRLRFDFATPIDDIPMLTVGKGGPAEVDLDALTDTDKRNKLARLLKEQRLRIRTLESNREYTADSSDREHRIVIHAYKNEIQKLQQTIEQFKVTNEKLQARLSSRNEQYIDLQDKVSGQQKLMSALEAKLKTASAGEREQLERQKMEAEIVLLTEQLDRRDLDLAVRDEREEQLKAELEELKETAGGGGDSIIEKLKKLEVVYVAYHPGAGHITMTSFEIHDYADNPTAFVAGKCFVTEDHYRRWLAHFESPLCRHVSDSGQECHQSVEKISVPSEFEPGISDVCEAHRPEEIE